MALDWSSVKKAHVEEALNRLSQEATKARGKARGLFVLHGGKRLPAKQVVRIAYCIANNISPDQKLKFASGDGTLNLLRRLGFIVERLGTIQGESPNTQT